ncbi:hypothetical protein [Asanoa siamensis]|uniref:Uncharacterized protein n=1 Tax=Asanoa siamensis TaxID=926357 RepID=A0ABQ4CJZ2_9ACTN|nr:hypothetical protein [Asanoa siamensis]GIF71288.1 hypothetical protein Asi02nite_08060 [Asanoa siamensis]
MRKWWAQLWGLAAIAGGVMLVLGWTHDTAWFWWSAHTLALSAVMGLPLMKLE